MRLLIIRRPVVVLVFPIIIVSAADIPDMEDSLKRAGAKAVFRKPANMNDLAKAIENLV